MIVEILKTTELYQCNIIQSMHIQYVLKKACFLYAYVRVEFTDS